MNSSNDPALSLLALALLAVSFKVMFRNFKTLSMRSGLRPQRLLDAAAEQRAERSYKLAIELLRRNEFSAAANYLSMAEEHLASSGIENLQLLCAILNQQSICLMRSERGSSAEVVNIIERSIKLAALSGKDKVMLDALFAKASICQGLGNAAEAEACLRRCLDLTEKIFGKDSEQKGRLLNNLGLSLFEQGRYVESLESFRTALPILERRTGADSSLCIQAREGQVQSLKRIRGY